MWRWLTVVIAALALSLAPVLVAAKESARQTPDWSVVIPAAFPGHVFTWRLHADGTYEEDAILSATGASAQETLTGRWRVEGARMVLTQDTLGYVFVGVVVEDHYRGTLFMNGDAISHFCAMRGAEPPRQCVANAGV